MKTPYFQRIGDPPKITHSAFAVGTQELMSGWGDTKLRNGYLEIAFTHNECYGLYCVCPCANS